jgi:surfeit locus 1 family protein
MSKARAWVLLGAAIVGAALTFRLGVWQLDRAAQKVALQQALDTRRALPPLPAAELATDAAGAAAQHHRRVALEGRWLPDATVYLENRQMHGQPGFFVLTPLALADGSAVLVQRGWLPRDPADRTRVQAPALPAGAVRVEGRIAPGPSRLYEFDAAASGPIRQNLELSAYAREIRVPLRPLSLLQEAPGGDGLLRDWSAPAADVHKHYGYAFQWFALAALITGLYVWFQLIRPRRAARA